jgi:hypothetical protein
MMREDETRRSSPQRLRVAQRNLVLRRRAVPRRATLAALHNKDYPLT